MAGLIRNRTSLWRRDTSVEVIAHYRNALAWVKQHTIPEQGIMVSDRQRFPYPEVTGYLIPTLIRAGELDWAYRYGRFLLYIQRPSGAFAGPDGREYAFDTGQVLRGLLALAGYFEEFKPAAAKAADYLVSCITEEGRIPSIYDKATPEQVHVYALPPLKVAAEVLGRPDYAHPVERAIAYYKNQPGTLSESCHTHFLSYMIEGFQELGEAEFARPVAAKIFDRQKQDGSISAYPDVSWVCTPGLAQLAVIAYRYGWQEQADRAVRRLCRVQNEAGGFPGSYGRGARYFSDEQVSWTNKYFLDAVHAMVTGCWSPELSTDTRAPDDPCCERIWHALGPQSCDRILDAGESSALTAFLQERIPEGEFLTAGRDRLLNLPYEDESFAAAYAIDTSRYVVEVDRAVKELCRIVREGGRIILMAKAGTVDETDLIEQILSLHCREVRQEDIVSPRNGQEVWRMWTAVKGARILTQRQWHDVIVGEKSVKALATSIRRNQYPPWVRPLIEHTCAGDAILELGSGTGELSAILAIYARKMTLLDYSDESLEYARMLFAELQLNGTFMQADLLRPLAMDDSSVDWVFSSGVLEHYTAETRERIMHECARVARKGVMSLVPNSRSLFYRLGKAHMEEEGQWPYGRETPQITMVPHFQQAGLKHITEYTVGSYHALAFSRKDQERVKAFYDGMEYRDLESLNQGYLLFTSGVKDA